MLCEHDYMRVEFDWLAHDLDELVVYVSSAGFGPVPSASLLDAARLEDVLDRARALPCLGEAVSVAQVLNPPDWMDAAKRGIFAYDWSDRSDSDRLIAKPTRPLRVHQLVDPEVRDMVQRVRLPLRAHDLQNIPPTSTSSSGVGSL
jgi:hypothetical protein